MGEEIIRPRRVWGRLLVRDLLSMGKMIPAAAAGGPNGITDEYCSYNLSRSLFVLILTISMDVFFPLPPLSLLPSLSISHALSLSLTHTHCSFLALPPPIEFLLVRGAFISSATQRNPITIITTPPRHSDIKAKTHSPSAPIGGILYK